MQAAQPAPAHAARIRVFDPACGSGNFLVIAYKQMREIEADINCRRGESHLASEIPLTNFRGIELRDFAAEIARLALIIAEFQCDVLYRGQKDALAKFLPLDGQIWIVCRNALRLNWLSICPPTGMSVKVVAGDLFGLPLRIEAPLCLTSSLRQIYLGIYVPKSLSGAAAMAQITLYLDDATQALVDHTAQANGVSKSRWVAELIRKHAAQEWPKERLDLAG